MSELSDRLRQALQAIVDHGDPRTVVEDSQGVDLQCGIYQLASDTISEIDRLTAEVERLQTQPLITPAMAQMLLDAQEAHIEGDWNEVYHQIRIFAHETTNNIYDSWKTIKNIALSTNQKDGGN